MEKGTGNLASAALYCFTLIDMDQDGIDEIYIVNNSDPIHPLWVEAYVLERMDVLTGNVIGQWPWPNYGGIQNPCGISEIMFSGAMTMVSLFL